MSDFARPSRLGATSSASMDLETSRQMKQSTPRCTVFSRYAPNRGLAPATMITARPKISNVPFIQGRVLIIGGISRASIDVWTNRLAAAARLRWAYIISPATSGRIHSNSNILGRSKMIIGSLRFTVYSMRFTVFMATI